MKHETPASLQKIDTSEATYKVEKSLTKHEELERCLDDSGGGRQRQSHDTAKFLLQVERSSEVLVD